MKLVDLYPCTKYRKTFMLGKFGLPLLSFTCSIFENDVKRKKAIWSGSLSTCLLQQSIDLALSFFCTTISNCLGLVQTL